MLHYVYQLVSNCVCLMFDVGQVVKNVLWKQLLLHQKSYNESSDSKLKE